jgi:hypothetical protein
MKASCLILILTVHLTFVAAVPGSMESDSMLVAGNTTSLSLLMSTAMVERRETQTEPLLGVERSHKGSTCRLLAEDPYMHRKLDNIAAGGSTDLVEYELMISGGHQPPVGKSH